MIDAALDAGVDFFDTADVYGNQGGSEEIIGRALAGRRDRVVLATKFGHDLGDGETARGSRPYIRKAIEASLRRLQTDRIDLYQYHRPDGVTPVEETLAALDELVQEGKVRAIGSSNFTATMVEEAHAVAVRARARRRSCPSRASTRGSPVTPRPSSCRRASGSGSASSPISRSRAVSSRASTAAASRRRRGRGCTGASSTSSDSSGSSGSRSSPATLGVSLLELAIGGLAAQPAVASVIAGATKPEQVRANAAAGAWEPSADELAALLSL